MSELVVSHDTEFKHFKINIENNCAYLAYEMVGDDTIDIYRTFVPDELRGQGIAALLVKAALAYVKEHNLKVIPSCSYVEVYMKKENLI